MGFLFIELKMMNNTKTTEINKLIGKKSKDPINQLLSYVLLSLLNSDYRQFKDLKIFTDRTHADISEIIYEKHKNDCPSFKKFLVGWRSDKEEIYLIIRIELYKHIILKNVREIKRPNQIITYRLTEQGQNFLHKELTL